MKKDVLVKQYSFEIGNAGCPGVEKERDSICFRIFLYTKQSASLILYRTGTDEIVQEISINHCRVMGNLFAVRVKALDIETHEYNYRIGEKVIQDPYARRIIGRSDFGVPVANGNGHQIRCGFVFSSYDWKKDHSPKIPYEETVMYELHVRGFTKQSSSKVRHKGTFKGIEEKADYLKELGVNQIKLMPAYEFDEMLKLHAGMHMNYKDAMEGQAEKLNCWGYESGFYFAPKSSYASTSDPVKEMKDMVRILHEYEIEIVMEFYFPKDITPRMAADCLLYWVTEYHIDGFHIVGNEELSYILAKDPLLADVKILGEYFPVEKIFTTEEFPYMRYLGEYNDGFMVDIRKILKGDDKQLSAFAYRVRKNPAYTGVINYITKHDGFTLFDLVSYNEKHNEENGEQNQDGSKENYSWNCGVEGATRKRKIVKLRDKQMRNALIILLLSAGTPMIRAGDEIANSQGGNNNPYCLDNETSWIDWKREKKYQELLQFVKKLIAFRKKHQILHMKKELAVMDTLSCGYPDLSYHGTRAWYGGFEETGCHLGMMYCGKYSDEEEFLYIAYNFHWQEQKFALPHLPEGMKWYLAVNTEEGVFEEKEETVLPEQNVYLAKERTITVLIGRK